MNIANFDCEHCYMNLSFENILLIILYVGAIQGIILTVLLFNAKRNRLSSRMLGTLTFFWGLILVVFAATIEGLILKFPHLLRTITHIELTFLPLLYLSIKYSLFDYRRFRRKDFLHFIPFVFNILLYSGFYFNSAEDKISMAISREGYYYIASIISDEILTIQGIVYPILALLIIRNYKRNLINYQSNIDVVVIKAMKTGTILIFIAWMVGGVAAHLYMFDINLSFDLFVITYLSIVAIIYVISFAILRSPETFKLSKREIEWKPGEAFWAKESSIDEGEYSGEQLTTGVNAVREDAEDSVHAKLLTYMMSDKPYLNPELSLQDLADSMDVSRHQLSAVINQQQKMNFYEFVNSYRVQEMKNLIKEPENKHLKLISLAFDAGFNSKASFNRIFKQFTGKTPSDYMIEFSHA